VRIAFFSQVLCTPIRTVNGAPRWKVKVLTAANDNGSSYIPCPEPAGIRTKEAAGSSAPGQEARAQIGSQVLANYWCQGESIESQEQQIQMISYGSEGQHRTRSKHSLPTGAPSLGMTQGLALVDISPN
jgi:hypothetical protein